MANLKSITDVPELAALMGNEKLMLNDGGDARQVSVGVLPGKVTLLEAKLIDGGTEAAQEILCNADGSETTVQQAYDALMSGLTLIKSATNQSSEIHFIKAFQVNFDANNVKTGVIIWVDGNIFSVGDVNL